MRYISLDRFHNPLTLTARIALIVLFIISGYGKLIDPAGAEALMAGKGLPLPLITAWVVIILEFVGGLCVLVGFYTRPLALLLALYTLASGFIGHAYWTFTGAEQVMNMINFYKNVGITGGFLLVALIGPGRYSLDRW